MPELDVEFRSGARTRCALGPGALGRIATLCLDAGLTGPAAVLCDARVLELHGPALAHALPEARFGPPIACDVSEGTKTLSTVERLCDALAARGLGRDGFVVAVGGGVLTDLAGLAAALHLRGVPWVSVPTTLLAQVDAGLGGKTGANLASGKNLVGAFHQPRIVACDPALLGTLPPRELWSGLAEVVKCALLDPAQPCPDGAVAGAVGGGAAGRETALPFLSRCERDLDAAATGDAAALAPLAVASVRLKAKIVAADEHEGGRRAHLNLGHTIGHALEAATGYGHFTHGEAVALGLRAALWLSAELGLLPAPEAARGLALVARLRVAPPRTLLPAQREAALAALGRDKKNRAGRLRFVLLDALGAARLVEVDPDLAARALDAALR